MEDRSSEALRAEEDFLFLFGEDALRSLGEGGRVIQLKRTQPMIISPLPVPDRLSKPLNLGYY